MYESVSRTNLLNYLENKDYLHIGNCPADWQAIVKESEELVKVTPDYWCSLVPDVGEYESWDHLGDELAKEYEVLRNWGYTKHNTRSWETTSIRPQLHMDWEKCIMDWLPLDHPISRPTLQPPGNIMPWHKDNFFFFKRKYPNEAKFIVRFLIFMKDWELGHLIQAGDSVITHWKAGDVILWYPTRMHIGANVGITNKWTLNVTGLLKETIQIPNVQLQHLS